MNRPILILCFFVAFFMGPPLYAEMHGSFEVGRDVDRPEAYAKVDLDYSFPVWVLTTHVYGGWETWLVIENSLPQNIIYDRYLVGLKIDIGDIYINIHHWCSHPLWFYPVPYKDDTNINLHQTRTVMSVGVKW